MEPTSGIQWLLSLPFLQMMCGLLGLKVFFSITKAKTIDDVKNLLGEIALLGFFVLLSYAFNG